jgi:hypothetical protein
VGKRPLNQLLEFGKQTMEIRIEITCSCGRKSMVQLSSDRKEYTCESCGEELFKAHISNGYVYVLSNPSMPNLLKIGYTERTVAERVEDLNSTGVPVPFEIEAIFGSLIPYEDEQTIHRFLEQYRLTSNREFFSIELKQALQCVIDCIGTEPSFLKSPELLMNEAEKRLYQKKLRKERHVCQRVGSKSGLLEEINSLEQKRNRLLNLFDRDRLESIVDHSEEEIVKREGLSDKQIESFVRWSVNCNLVSYLSSLEGRSFSKDYLESLFVKLESLRAQYYQYDPINWAKNGPH